MSPHEERRITELERRVARLEDRVTDVPVLQNEMRNVATQAVSARADLRKDMDELREELSSVRRALYTAALSVAGGFLLGALTILQVFR